MVSTPDPPDPYETANAQTQSNLQSAQANAIIGNANERNPYGSVNYNRIGYETIFDSEGNPMKVPRYQRTVSLTPAQQKLLNLQTATQQNLGQLGVTQSRKLQGLLGTSLNTRGLTNWQGVGNAPKLDARAIRQDQDPTDRKAVEAAMMSRYDTDASDQAAAQDANLAARGLNPGSSQYADVLQERARGRTDALNQAYLASGAESRAAQEAYNAAQQMKYGVQQQNWANILERAGFLNNLRGAQLQERQTIRNAPINEISALMSGSQVTVPQFQPFASPNVPATPIASYIYDNYNARAQNAASANAGLFGLAGAVAGAPWWG